MLLLLFGPFWFVLAGIKSLRGLIQKQCIEQKTHKHQKEREWEINKGAEEKHHLSIIIKERVKFLNSD